MFGVMSENDKYKLILGNYSGNLLCFCLRLMYFSVFVKKKLKATMKWNRTFAR